MKKVLFFVVMLVNILVLGFSQTNAWTVNNIAAWIDVVGGIRSGGNNKEYAVTVTGTISVPSSTENTFGSVSGITVTIQGNGTLSPSDNGSLLYIGDGQTIVDKDIILRGHVEIENGGAFRMEGSAAVSGSNVSIGLYPKKCTQLSGFC